MTPDKSRRRDGPGGRFEDGLGLELLIGAAVVPHHTVSSGLEQLQNKAWMFSVRSQESLFHRVSCGPDQPHGGALVFYVGSLVNNQIEERFMAWSLGFSSPR